MLPPSGAALSVVSRVAEQRSDYIVCSCAYGVESDDLVIPGLPSASRGPGESALKRAARPAATELPGLSGLQPAGTAAASMSSASACRVPAATSSSSARHSAAETPISSARAPRAD